ncbi:MAG: hypothetical protein ACJAT2_002803 [Bacteriovoracaceae bacterium]|jgi:hypothetical protein
MNKFLLLFFILITSCSSSGLRSPAGKTDVIDIVFDLDWTLISKVDPSLKGRKGIIEIGEELYRVHDWARELVTALVLDPKYRVSFFSGGPSQRNIKVLEAITIVDGSERSFLEVSHKALHREDLLLVDPPADLDNPAPADRWKKDLTKINEDLKKIVMFEDDYRHALNPKQRQNILWMGMSFYHIDSKKELREAQRSLSDDSFVPPSIQKWQLQRNKLAISFGVLEQAMEDKKNSSLSLSELVQKRLKQSGIEENTVTKEGRSFFDRGSSILRRVNPRAQKVALENHCNGLIALFF